MCSGSVKTHLTVPCVCVCHCNYCLFAALIRPASDVVGGSLPPEIMTMLPGYFFSNTYLQTLACVSKTMLLASRDPQHWRGRCFSLAETEFADPAVLRNFAHAYEVASVVRVDESRSFSSKLFVSSADIRVACPCLRNGHHTGVKCKCIFYVDIYIHLIYLLLFAFV